MPGPDATELLWIDGILVLIAIESVMLGLWAARRRIAVRPLLVNLAAGTALLLGIRCALAGQTTGLLLALSCALVAHLADLRFRLEKQFR